MRLPRLFRTTPFRLTLLFLAVFAAAASALLAYIYVTTAGEVNRSADQSIAQEMRQLEQIFARDGTRGLNQAIIERSASGRAYLYLLLDEDGEAVSGSIHRSPIEQSTSARMWSSRPTCARPVRTLARS